MKWLAGGLVASPLLLLAGCNFERSNSDAVVFSMTDSGPDVQNGWAYDKASLAIDSGLTLVVPDNAVVQTSLGDQIELFFEKSLHYTGHPVKPLSITQVRDHLGCARKRENGKVVICTIGEWDSNIEGGASLTIVIRVPKNVVVERKSGLSGGDSVANQAGRTRFDSEWEVIPSSPDIDRTAKSTRHN